MKQEIRNRWTNAVQFTADITCAPDATIGVRIGLAVKWARQKALEWAEEYCALSGVKLPKVPAR